MSFLFDRLYALSYKEKPTETTLLLSLLLNHTLDLKPLPT